MLLMSSKKRNILLILFSVFPFIAFSQNIEEIFQNKKEIYFSFSYTTKNKIDKLSKIISLDHKTNHTKAYAYANRNQFKDFLDYNIEYELIDEDYNFNSVSGPKSTWDYYPTYAQYVSLMQSFADSFPSICKLHNIGTLSSGHEILIVQISDNVGLPENEPSFLYTSSMHGNELTGYVLMLRLIDELLHGYGTSSQYTSLIDEIDIWINPLANPDGAYAGGDHTVNGATRYNAQGVDLNRNYPDPLAGDHPDGNSWQEETILFMNLADSINFNLSCNIHTGAEVFNYPWDTWSNLAADDGWWQYVARNYADTVHSNSANGYFNDLSNGVTNGWDWYEVDGGRQDFMNYFKFCREFTLELSSNKIPSPLTLPTFWNSNASSLVNYIEQSLFGVRGIVTDSLTGSPLQAKVEIFGHDYDSSHVYSNLPIGNYHRYLNQGNYQLNFSKNGYQSKTIDVSVNNNLTTYLDVQLSPAGFVGLNQINKPKEVVKRIDILGRNAQNNNGIQLYLNSDGTVDKKVIIK